jgi:hypothetical protein
MLALLLLGAGTAVAGLVGHVDLEDPPLPWLAEEALTPAQVVAEEQPEEAPGGSPEAPDVGPEETLAMVKETPDVPSEAPDVPPELEASLEDSPQAAALVPVPSVDAYFDYFAAQILRNSGFQPQLVYGYREGYAANGVAWGTDPAVGTLMPLGSTITVYATPKEQPQAQLPRPQIQASQPQIQQPRIQPQIQVPQPQMVQPQIRG